MIFFVVGVFFNLFEEDLVIKNVFFYSRIFIFKIEKSEDFIVKIMFRIF